MQRESETTCEHTSILSRTWEGPKINYHLGWHVTIYAQKGKPGNRAMLKSKTRYLVRVMKNNGYDHYVWSQGVIKSHGI